MAAPGGKFFIHDKLGIPAKHHESFEQLWETKWKPHATMGVYPFMFGTASDFAPILASMKASQMREPYNWDTYARTFFPTAQSLYTTATTAEAAGELEKASEYYLRASAVYRIARFPAPRSPLQREAWALGKDACLKGLSLRPHPVERGIGTAYAPGNQNEGDTIPVASMGDGTELTVRKEWNPSRGRLHPIVLEIPGTGDCPANVSDPTSPDRLYSSLFDWVEAQPRLHTKKTAIWAFSTGGYYAIRVAHTHPERLAGVVALGGGCHHMFDREWLDHVNHLEYPFDLADTLAYKWGYGNDVEAFKQEASAKFSLLNDGTLDKPVCARLLLVNGTEDEIFPIDDYYLALQHGMPKEARFVQEKKHMGEPDSFFIILKWLYQLLGVDAQPGRLMATLPFKPKY
ncbi:conidial pigment biosynthesis protein Ayg1 [Pyrenophora tritici-repentis Pt-1C-BFP]|uniref:Conidial pigment biosynthesis protein Ayg1 n=1 Tax=Pyrenophora tritici-repentis (strain Pt-1C-BFP) TaxID=426418 RepID=B2WN01_PYRTR|nr:conidial pigment biosynthesis protein Ayg1 [Pyrenophora tritici-repentis Pt-1C-BFP]EDU44500.1 conidial pigment biosynthesis protein Ayg1 [Pyrenophora tritici-repentis Pt-1C-BFP]